MKKTFLSFFLIAGILCCKNPVIAQVASLENVVDVELKSSLPIINNHTIVGYAFFYKTDQEKKVATYRVEILDENLKHLGNAEFEGSKSLKMVRALYESEHIMLAFDDPKKLNDVEKYSLTFDLKGKQTGNAEYDPEKVKKGMFGAAVAEQMESMFNGFDNVEGKGFVCVYQSKAKKGGADIIMLNTSGKQKWQKTLEGDGERMDAYLTTTTPNALVFFCAVRKNIMAKDADIFLVGLNPDNGKELYRKPMDATEYSYEPLLFKSDDNALHIISMIGEKGDKFYTARQKGFSLGTFDDKTGEIKKEKDLFYAEDLGSVLNMKSDDKSEEGFMKIHNIEYMPDGSKVIIGEFWRRTVSALGATMKILSKGGGSASQVSLGDLFLLRLDANNKAVALEKVEKKVERNALPADGISIGLINRWLDAEHICGYLYTDLPADPAKRTVLVQGSFDGDKYGTTAITFDNTKGVKRKKFNIEEGKHDQVWIMRAKPGHVLITKYNSKDKKISLNLERVDS